MGSARGNMCESCGYDLRELAEGAEFGVCPECGGRFAPAVIVPEPRPCPRCGYDLTGIDAKGYEATCPECGLGFWPDSLEFMKPPWPPMLSILGRVCLPAWGVFALVPVVIWGVLLLGAGLSDHVLAWILAVLVIAMLTVGAIVVPALMARQLVRRHTPTGEHIVEQTVGLVVTGLMVHAIIGSLMLLAFAAVW